MDDRVPNSMDGLNDSPRQSSNRRTNGESPRTRIDDTTAAAAAAAATRSKRRQETASDALPVRSKESRPSTASSGHGRSKGSSNAPEGPTREPSAVINRVVVSSPEEDLVREHERLVEAAPGSEVTPITGLSVVPGEGVEDGGRGARSRQDHSSSGKKEKNTRFGEYYLGSTLGEGEFGKVKMGWKQEGGVQVSSLGYMPD